MLLFRLWIAFFRKEEPLAISNILPRKLMKNRTRQQSMAERHDYDQKEEKTDGGELVSSYMCSPETAAEEFEISKKIYAQLTGRSQSEKHDIIMYRIIQSFKPGERNDLGDELADLLWVTIAIANQTGIDLTEAFQRNLEKKTDRDSKRHISNPKLNN